MLGAHRARRLKRVLHDRRAVFVGHPKSDSTKVNRRCAGRASAATFHKSTFLMLNKFSSFWSQCSASSADRNRCECRANRAHRKAEKYLVKHYYLSAVKQCAGFGERKHHVLSSCPIALANWFAAQTRRPRWIFDDYAMQFGIQVKWPRARAVGSKRKPFHRPLCTAASEGKGKRQ